MARQPHSMLQTKPPAPIFWFAIAFSVAAGTFLSSYYVDRRHVAIPGTTLQMEIKAVRSGHDADALSIFKPIAEKGDPKAQYWMADIYENGLGVKRDMPTSLKWLTKSASQGFMPAQRHLGGLYLRGDKTLQDFGLAQTWLSKAAFAGDNGSQRELGRIYGSGLGVPVDVPKAYAWLENAALGGDDLAQSMRNKILVGMSEAAAAEEQAKQISSQIQYGAIQPASKRETGLSA